MGEPKTTQWMTASKNTAMTNLSRLELSGPNFLPAKVKNIDEIEKHTAVRSAAISPMLGVMIPRELLSGRLTGLINSLSPENFTNCA